MITFKFAVGILGALFACGLYSACSMLFGAGVLRFIKILPENRTLSTAGYLSSIFFLGQGLLAVLWQTMSLFGGFSIMFTLPILILTTLLGASFAPSILRMIIRGFGEILSNIRSLDFIWKCFASLILLLLLVFFMLTLAPPNGDALAYYMAQQKLMALTHSFSLLPSYEAMCHFGLNAEMHGAFLFLTAGEFAGEYAINMLIWVTSIFCGVSLWAISEKLGLSKIGRWSVMLMLYTSTAFTFLMWGGKTDLIGTGLALASIYWVLQIGKISDWKAMVISGLLAGLAINSKMSFIIVLIPMLVTMATCLLNKRYNDGSIVESRFMYILWPLLIAGSSVLITWAPLILKNSLLFSEPLAPFFYFGSESCRVTTEVWYSPENTRWIAMTYPIALTFGQYPMQAGNVTPMLLAYAIVPFFFKGFMEIFHNKALKYITFSALLGLVFWVFLRPSILAPRYILPTILVLLPIGGLIIEKIWALSGYFLLRLSIILSTVIMLTLTVDNLSIFLDIAKYYSTYNREKYTCDTWKAIEFINSSANPGDRVFLAMYSRFYLRPDLLMSLFNLEEVSSINAFPKIFQHNKKKPVYPLLPGYKKSSYSFWEGTYRYGAKWVIFDKTTHLKYTSEDLVNMSNIPDYLDIVEKFKSGNVIVYELIPKKGAPLPLKVNRQLLNGTWKVQPTAAIREK